jgi:hypothetical protein
MDREPTTVSRRKRRWALRLLVAILIVALVSIGLFLAIPLLEEREADQTEADLQAAIAEVDRVEPKGWTLDDLERQREQIPNGENGSRLVIEAAKLLPEAWKNDLFVDEVQELPPPCRLTAEHGAALRSALEKLEPALKVARSLAGYARGRFPPMRLADDQFTYENPHMAGVRDLALALYCDAIGRTEQGDLSRAWDSAVAVLNTERAIGDEPAIRSQLCRMVTPKLAVKAMERVLGQGAIASNDLAVAQSLLTAELRFSLLATAIRGERAMQHDFYTRLARGEPPLDKVVRPGKGTSDEDKIRHAIIGASVPRRRAIIASSHSYTLRKLTEALTCVSDPEAVCDKDLGRWWSGIWHDKAQKTTPLLAALLTPNLPSIRSVDQKKTTWIRCAIAALAAERFRLQSQRWPKDLTELVHADLLPEAPLDPFPLNRDDADPLQLRFTRDGLCVHSVVGTIRYAGDFWDDLTLSPLARHIDFGDDFIEFRLWNPDHRGKAPVARAPD